MTPLESLIEEGIPRGLPPKAETWRGPSRWLMAREAAEREAQRRVEAQQLLWELAAEDTGQVPAQRGVEGVEVAS